MPAAGGLSASARRCIWMSRLVFVGVSLAVTELALGAYLPTLAPTITWRNDGSDSGDLAAAVATLGIAHPPGYPTYVLFGRAWAALPLGGDLAYRLNLLSAVCAALGAGLAAAAILRLGTTTRMGRETIGERMGGQASTLRPSRTSPFRT